GRCPVAYLTCAPMAFQHGDRVVAVEHDHGVGTVMGDGGPVLGVQTYRVRWPTEETLYMPEDSIRLATDDDLDD
ncbi:MAG: hypothetical protein ACXVHK_32755, partial [Solirubrobacteraceae bacterium]